MLYGLLIIALLLLPLHARADQACAPISTPKTTVPLQWLPPETPTTLPLVHYRLERKRDKEGWKLVATFPPDTTHVTDGPLETGHTYKFRVFAVYQPPSGELQRSVEAPYIDPPPCYTIQKGQETPPPAGFSGVRE